MPPELINVGRVNAVQWDTRVTLEHLGVVLGSLPVTLDLIELVIKRTNVLRGLFGMKTRRRQVPWAAGPCTGSVAAGLPSSSIHGRIADNGSCRLNLVEAENGDARAAQPIPGSWEFLV